MDISIRNVKGIMRADIEVRPVAIIAAKNARGKSSICEAVGSALTGHVIPYIEPGDRIGSWKSLLPKSAAAEMVYDGTAQGTATIAASKDDQAAVTWPESEYATLGEPPTSSPICANLADFFSMPEKHRAAVLTEALGTLPSEEDFLEEMDYQKVSPATAAKVWNVIKEDGWDQAYIKIKEHGTKMKGQWEAVAGSRYGGVKAAEYLPEGWDESFKVCSLEALELKLEGAEKAVVTEAVAKGPALTEEEVARLTDIAAKAIPSQKEIQDDLDIANHTLEKAQAALPELPAAKKASTLTCPHCKEEVIFSMEGGEPSLGCVPPYDEFDQAGYDTAQAEVEKATTLVTLAEIALADWEEVDEARTKLQTMNTGEAPSKATISPEEAAVIQAKKDIDIFKKWTESHRLHEAIKRNQALIDALAPTGLRKKILQRAIEDFNGLLADLSTKAGWNTVSIDQDMNAFYGKRMYLMSSGGEKFRMRATLQVAIGIKDGSKMLIVDGCDVLDLDGKNGLLKMIIGAKIPAILSFMMASADLVPVYPEKFAKSYWLEGGKCERLEKGA